MKNFGIFIFFISFLASCTLQIPCTDDIVGTYEGTCISTLGNFQGTVKISKSADDDYRLLIEDSILASKEVLKGTTTAECGTITVPTQSFINSSGKVYTVSGNYKINEKSLTGGMTIILGNAGATCTYSMVKKE